MMEFLYFPQNKLLYIPAVLTLIIFFLGAVLFMQWIKRVSDKQSAEAKKLEEQLYKANSDNNQTGMK